jgi:hypothetical protein
MHIARGLKDQWNKCNCYSNQLHFIPLIFESPGYVHEYVCDFVAKVAEFASKVKLIPQEAIYKYWMTQFSVTLQKGLALPLYAGSVLLSTRTVDTIATARG